MQFYTYLHCKPDGTPFYVGKGCGGRAYDLFHRNQHHKRIVAKHGITVFILPCDSEDQAIADEIRHIAQLRAEGFALCNKTNGGDGISGLVHSETTKAKMSAAAQGNTYGRGCKGKILSAETKARIAASKTGQKLPPFSAEHRARMAAKAFGNKRGIGNKSRLGQKASAETRAKMSASHLILWAKRKFLTSEN